MIITTPAYLCTKQEEIEEQTPFVFRTQKDAIQFCKDRPEYGWTVCRLSLRE